MTTLRHCVKDSRVSPQFRTQRRKDQSMATRADAELTSERTKLLSSSSSSSPPSTGDDAAFHSRWSRRGITSVFVSCLVLTLVRNRIGNDGGDVARVLNAWERPELVAVEAMGAAKPVVDSSARLGKYNVSNPRPQSGPQSPITYTLHMGCESDALKSVFPDFFGAGATITEVRIVHHNYNTGAFFEWHDGIVMQASNLFPGDTSTWTATTAELNWEWGFALKNSNGQVLREIGPNKYNSAKIRDLPDKVLTASDSCVTSHGGYINRIITIDALRHTERSPAGFVDFTFGACRESCAPEGEPHRWTQAERNLMTNVLEAQPPRGLGFSYMMYGWNNLGVCTMNLKANRSPPDDPDRVCNDYVIHFDPRPMNFGNARFITDDKRCEDWQYAYAPANDQSWWWKTDKLGPVEENDPNFEWRIDFKYTAPGLEIRMGANREYYNIFPWSGDSGVDAITDIILGFNANYHRSGVPGTCYLSAVWPERVPVDPFYGP
jgi:hypothetical protein